MAIKIVYVNHDDMLDIRIMNDLNIYRVTVDIPNTIYIAFGHNKEWEQMFLTAVSDSFDSGEILYNLNPEVWALFHSEGEARMCNNMLISMVDYFKGKL